MRTRTNQTPEMVQVQVDRWEGSLPGCVSVGDGMERMEGGGSDAFTDQTSGFPGEMEETVQVLHPSGSPRENMDDETEENPIQDLQISGHRH